MRVLLFLAVLISGLLFGLGLSLATMIRPEVVLDFLLFHDLGLLLVLGGAVMVSLLAYQWGPRWLKKPILGDAYARHPSRLDARTLVGAAIFGMGWGICGVCPGPAIAGLGAGNWPLILALVGIFAGAYIQGRFFPGD
ncbi:MAG: YeeE/YedE thiosulfate transporter family protein [Methylococcaceae bacterium]|nr:YeeE/YedE thiosulfate transporter family protein [Methylococcaceae bacterium]